MSSDIKKVLLTKKHEITGVGSFHKVIPVGIYEVVSYANVYKIVSDGIYKGDNLPKELCQMAKDYSIEYVTKLEIKAARGDQELERLRTKLEETERSRDVMSSYLNELLHNTANMVIASQIVNVLREAVGREQELPDEIPNTDRYFKFVGSDGEVSGLFRSNDKQKIEDQRQKMQFAMITLAEISKEDFFRLAEEMDI